MKKFKEWRNYQRESKLQRTSKNICKLYGKNLEKEWTGWAGEIEVDTRDTEELVGIEVISKLLSI